MSEKLINYTASPTAQRFHRSDAFVRGVMGPFGCLAPDTLVLTEEGPLPISEIDRPMRVVSWNAELGRYQLSLTGGSFPKGKDYLYRVSTQQGEFAASGHHRVLCEDGTYRRVDSLSPGQRVFRCSASRSLTNPSLASVLPVDARHCLRTAEDFVGHYAASARQYGLQLLWDLDSDQSCAPLQGDVQGCDLFSERGGGYGPERLHTHQGLYSALPSMTDSLARVVRHDIEPAGQVFSEPCEHSAERDQQSWQSHVMSAHHQTDQLFCECYYSYTKILHIQKEQVKTAYWDMQVMDTNNYVTIDGAVHHNSGKSVMMVWEIFMRARAQNAGPDGIRRSRWIIARNTQPQLETTTIKTWLDWFPEHIFGKMSRKPPFTHNIKMAGVELEVIFLALDKPDDVKKLLSFEVTGVFFNEAREMEYDIISGATGRVGRYPSPAMGGCKWSGIIMDTNPPTDDHWWYKMAEEQAWAVDKFGNPLDVDDVPPEDKWEFWKQPSGLAPDAENLENLMQPPGCEKMSLAKRRKAGRKYYERQLGGKTEEWISVYVHGNYGFIKQGMPVYKGAWNPDIHTSKENIPTPASGTIYVGVDASGRHPAAVFLYRTLSGQLNVVHELCVTGDEGMGAVSFARLLKSEMGLKFPTHDFSIWGDPAGAWASQNDERTYFDILKAQGIFIKPSPGLRIPERIETVIASLGQNIQGKPKMLVSPACRVLLRGMNGGYRYRKLNTSGGRYDDKPEKNRYSDIQDALQYVLCGMGEMNRMYGRNKNAIRETKFAGSGYRIGT